MDCCNMSAESGNRSTTLLEIRGPRAGTHRCWVDGEADGAAHYRRGSWCPEKAMGWIRANQNRTLILAR